VLKLRANAKINLTLKILGSRPDGFHDLESVMQSVSLYDQLSLEPAASGIKLTTSNPQLPTDDKNLAYRAAQSYLNYMKERGHSTGGVNIMLEKNIPLAAGLAGGSADAAAVLLGLNNLLGNPLQNDELMEIGAGIGSDVPFCLIGGNCLVRGRGEKISKRENVIGGYYVLVVPAVEVSTRWAYEAWDKKKADTAEEKEAWNALEAVVMARYPLISEVKEKLTKLGCQAVRMSGSGSSVFGEIQDSNSGNRIVAEMKKQFNQSFLVKPVNNGVEETN
jgi:4-diphosphocytidyl-2-C-methyl-D-erythritol kinase